MAAVLCPTLAHCLKFPLALYLKISPLFYLGFSGSPSPMLSALPLGPIFLGAPVLRLLGSN